MIYTNSDNQFQNCWSIIQKVIHYTTDAVFPLYVLKVYFFVMFENDVDVFGISHLGHIHMQFVVWIVLYSSRIDCVFRVCSHHILQLVCNWTPFR